MGKGATKGGGGGGAPRFGDEYESDPRFAREDAPRRPPPRRDRDGRRGLSRDDRRGASRDDRARGRGRVLRDDDYVDDGFPRASSSEYSRAPRGGRGGRGARGSRGGGRGGRGGRGRRDERDAYAPFEVRGGAFESPRRDAPGAASSAAFAFDPSTRNDTGQNDWDCASCGADNFARRVACFRCGAERGADPDLIAPRPRRERSFDAPPAPRPPLPSRRSRSGAFSASYDDDERLGALPRGHSRYYATCHPGLEDVVAAELRDARTIGASNVVPGASGVAFTGDARTGYLANVWLRSAIRVLCELRHGWLDPAAPGGVAVYDFVRGAAPWEEVLGATPNDPNRVDSGYRSEYRTDSRDASEVSFSTFSFEARVWSCSDVTSTRLAATRAKDAVCDALVDATGSRPPKPPDGHSSADVPMFLTLYRDEATLYRDMSGKSLHRRGYRDAALHRAALNESAAAGALAIAGWAEACERARREPSYRLPVLVDPMCGSGTILIEAALMAGAVAPGLVRADASHAARRNAFAFENWPDHDRDALDSVLREAGELGREARKALGKKPVLVGCEIHPGALSLARRAARLAGVEALVDLTEGDCRDFAHPAVTAEAREEAEDDEAEDGDERSPLDTLGPVALRRGGGGVLVVSNPPWGRRVGGGDARGDEYYGNGGNDDEGFFDGDGPENGGDWERASAENDPASVENAWSALGAFFRRECGGATAHLLSGDAAATRPLRMRARRKRVLGVGGVDCRLLEYRVLPPKKADARGLEELAREERRREEEAGAADASSDSAAGKLTVEQLKTLLRSRGESVGGRKADLVARVLATGGAATP